MSKVVADEMGQPDADGMYFKTTGPTGRVRRGKLMALKTRKVCKAACNEGWLHDLEETVRPILEPMIRATRVTLSDADKLALAAWATGRAVVWDIAAEHAPRDLGRPLYTPEERRWFGRQQRPFDESQVWLGGYQYEQGAIAQWRHRTTTLRVAGDSLPVGVGSVLQFGVVLFRIFHTYRPPTLYRLPNDDALTDLWPYVSDDDDVWPKGRV